ncbi:hypothetical protein DXG03_006934 [Asterophora parasitica]|uniref:HSF-type DNA-binding domain-containing protein n=1 Tax=Asterophora parasitica TaxID=117018 RepID=A0A9P7G2D4_9AGAR|nr:hypothetical protein DXG03_006934 [Asterophora parasitica]
MATGQVALARHRAPVPVQKSSRQAVPAFLQKLHEMVNDPNNHELIRWSEAGDSFYVLDHERFAREVLGRWFKHQNFASFVRQLNMYGFHKIPHLQQGVLRSDTDTEFWNFAHANFHRGQPDLLCLIQRKKQTAQPGDEVVMDLRETANVTPVQASASSGQVVDIHSIVNGIAAIKRHQSTISAELNELKRSNQLLWQDAMDARAKHQKQQDTINRIVKFLAGVFGNHAGPHKEDVVESNPSRAVIPRRQSRFLIEGSRSTKVAFEDEREDTEGDFSEVGDLGQAPYPIIETPQSIPSPAYSDRTSPGPSVGVKHPSQGAPHAFEQPLATPSIPTPPIEPTPSAYPTPSLPRTTSSQPTDAIERSVTPSRTPTNVEFDPRIQLVLNQLTPLQIQQLLSSLSHTMDPIPPTDSSPSSSQLTQYTPPTDLFSHFINPSSSQRHDISAPAPADGLLSFDDQHDMNLEENAAGNVGKAWRGPEDIERDVNAMNADIDTFIRNLGLDPKHIVNVDSDNQSPSTPSLNLEPDDMHPHTQPPPPLPHSDTSAGGDQIFDFDSFLHSFSANPDTTFSTDGEPFADMNPNSVGLDALPTMKPPPVPQSPQGVPIPGVRGASPVTSKRKSDASELAALLPHSQEISPPTDSTTASSKPSKRRRNK